MWNNNSESKRFLREQKKMIEEYKKMGMKDEQISVICDYDKQVFLSDRRFYSRLSSSNDEIMDDIELDNLTLSGDTYITYDTYALESDPLLNGIEDKRLINIIKHASKNERKVIFLLSQGFNQKEIAKIMSVSKQYISKMIQKFRNFNEF